uniref:Uncharacterized protein n=1 Tax=Acinetobacter sp. M131 TaxID=1280052 RepID=V9M5I0_9GAMM|nr:hypothetical protein [Acinetobacter sp. M131]AGC70586.1 hypothetical protein [Acinetobacter sp. M131]
MAVSHTTLLNYLGKQVTYRLPANPSIHPSGFKQDSGQVVGVLLMLDGDHQVVVRLHEHYDEYVRFSDMNLINLSAD